MYVWSVNMNDSEKTDTQFLYICSIMQVHILLLFKLSCPMKNKTVYYLNSVILPIFILVKKWVDSFIIYGSITVLEFLPSLKKKSGKKSLFKYLRAHFLNCFLNF